MVLSYVLIFNEREMKEQLDVFIYSFPLTSRPYSLRLIDISSVFSIVSFHLHLIDLSPCDIFLIRKSSFVFYFRSSFGIVPSFP